MNAWRWFAWRDVQAAKDWADAGGVAVHENPLGYRWAKGRCAHLFAQDQAALARAGRALGVPGWAMQGGNREHFDLRGRAYATAIAKCDNRDRAEV